MDKEALLKIILSDISEVETLVKSFQGSQNIPAAFIDLTERKLSHIKDEFGLLKSLSEQNTEPSMPKAEYKESGLAEKKEVVVDVLTPQYIESKLLEKTPATAPEEISSEIKRKPIEAAAADFSSCIENKVPEKTSEPTPVEKSDEVREEEAKEEVTIKPAEPLVEVKMPEPVFEPEVIAKVVEKPEPVVKITTKESTIIPLQDEKSEPSKTLGESFVGEKKSVNDLMASSQESKINKALLGKPIGDLTKGLGINDRFLFQRELFSGNTDLMQQTLRQLNDLPDFSTAKAFIASNFNWDNEQAAVKTFFNYIKRKY